MNEFDVWRIATTTKMHFTSTYDAFKYNFKSPNLTPAAFNRRKDKGFFIRAAKILRTERDIRRYVFANILFDNTLWLGSMTDEPVKKYNAHLQNLSYLFAKDLRKFKDKKFDWLLQPGEDYPPIIKEYLASNVLPETVILLNGITNYLNVIRINDTILWPEIQQRLTKATPFILADVKDTKKYHKIILEIFTPNLYK